MSAALVYLAACGASWGAMGILCLRSDSIRNRYRWPKLGKRKQWYAVAAASSSALALIMLWRIESPSFALLMWTLMHGLCGMLVAVCMPYAVRQLPQTFVAAAGLAACSLPLFLLTSGV